jgi:hypothetical protein
MGQMIAEYKVGKAVYQVTEEGFVDNINPRLPNMAIVYPWERIYAALEYERERNPRTGLSENVVRWMRVYDKRGSGLIAQMAITDALRESMFQFYRVFQATQERALNTEPTTAPLPSNVRPFKKG